MKTIGSDPEFVITDKQSNYIPANELFGNCSVCDPCEQCGKTRCIGNRSQCGACRNCTNVCDNCSICDDCDSCREESFEYCGYCEEECRNDFDIYGEIGCDDNMDVGELRPCYATTPNEHHSNIKDLIFQIDIPKEYEIRAGAYVDGLSIGGHIHLGLDVFECGETDLNGISKYLSQHAGMLFRKIEIREDLKHRGFHESGYGKFGDYDEADWGIEWRMLPSWLVSSDIALSALSLAYVVGSEYEINPEVITRPDLPTQIRNFESTSSATRMINKVEKMTEYKKYSKELEPLFQMLINKEKWKTNVDIRDEW